MYNNRTNDWYMESKKQYILITVVLITIAYRIVICKKACQRETSLISANVEALTDDEAYQRHGRYRTVGCGSNNVIDWRPYCCPHEYYDTCPDMVDPMECTLSLQSILGCE